MLSKFERAVELIAKSADKLSEYSADTGNETSRLASSLLTSLNNALVFGKAYRVIEHAQAFQDHLDNLESR